MIYRFLVVIEKADGNYAAYSLDLPGCVATGATPEETKRRIAESIALGLNHVVPRGVRQFCLCVREALAIPSHVGRFTPEICVDHHSICAISVLY